MRRVKAFTLVELLVVVGIIGLLAAILVPTLNQANELTNRTVCKSNLKNLSSGIQLYVGEGDKRLWPWIHNVDSGWDMTETGENRDKDPYEDPNNPGDRSVTALMFLLVRQRQPVSLFVCPSDEDVVKDENIKNLEDAGEDEEPEFYWDFSRDINVSYSWQAPRQKGSTSKYIQGISDDDSDVIFMADKTPKWTDPSWQATDVSQLTTQSDIQEHMSQNHSKGKKMNVLSVGMNVRQVDRPDVGANRDNIFTASGKKRRGDRAGTSTSIGQHYAAVDSYLIGPVGESDSNVDQ